MWFSFVLITFYSDLDIKIQNSSVQLIIMNKKNDTLNDDLQLLDSQFNIISQKYAEQISLDNNEQWRKVIMIIIKNLMKN